MSREEICKILGIPVINNESELKVAWRKLVLKHHPDRNTDPNATTKFIKIQKLFEELTKSFNVAFSEVAFTIRINPGSSWNTTTTASNSYTWSY